MRAQRQVEIGEASLARAREQLEISRALIEAGQMAAREILHSEANIAARELDLVQILNGVSAANFALIDILDIDSATVLRPVEVVARKRPRPKLEESIGTALRQSPGHARALLDKEIAAINLAVAESDTLWDLSLGAEATRGMGDGAERIDYSAGVRLTIPFWNRPAELGLMRAKADVRRPSESWRRFASRSASLCARLCMTSRSGSGGLSWPSGHALLHRRSSRSSGARSRRAYRRRFD